MSKYLLIALIMGLGACASCSSKEEPRVQAVCPDAGAAVEPMRSLPGPDCRVGASRRERVMLPFDMKLQQCTLWCWAAAASALAEYNGVHMPACKAASLETGQDCCVLDPCFKPGCDRAIQSTRVAELLGAGGIIAEHLRRPLTEDELQRELSYGRPVLIVWESKTLFSGQHMVVLSGYEKGLYRVSDPDPGAKHLQLMAYGGIKGGQIGELAWIESWVISSKQKGACQTP